MHYYQFNLSDYITATAHLKPIQDLAYRRLLDFYYEKEKPIPNETEWVSNRIRLPDDTESVELVLKEFFTLTDENVWVHDICDANIAAYQKRCKTNKANSIKGGRPKKTDSVSNGIPNQEPITNNHKPKKERASLFIPPKVPEVAVYCIQRQNNIDAQTFVDHYEANGWMRGKTKIKDWKACVRTWEKREDKTNGQNQQDNRSRAQRVSDELDRLAQEAINRGETI